MPESAAPPPVGRPRSAPLVVGLCGGVGCGKSAVAAALGRRGALVVDADRLAHAALDDPAVRERVVAEFGTGILGPDDRIERARLRPLVFGDAPERLRARRLLESLVHPVVRRSIDATLAEVRLRPDPPPCVVLDVPLLVEGETAALCDVLVFVDAPDDVRRARTAKDRGWTEAEHRAREAAQATLAEKRAWSRYVVRNDGDLAALEPEVDRLFAALVVDGGGRPGPAGR